MTLPDVKVLIGEVAARHGITLRPDDPAFALVTVNQLVLEQTMMELIGRTQTPDESLPDDTEDITSAGVRSRQSAEAIPRAQSGPVSYWWLSAGLIAALALFVIGILVGRAWR